MIAVEMVCLSSTRRISKPICRFFLTGPDQSDYSDRDCRLPPPVLEDYPQGLTESLQNFGGGQTHAFRGNTYSSLSVNPWKGYPACMAALDALLVYSKKSELSRHVIPTKTLAYLAVGQPVLMAMDGAAAQLTEKVGAGLVASLEDASAVAEGIRLFADMRYSGHAAMGKRGRDYVAAHFPEDYRIAQYEAILEVAAQEGK